LTPQNADRVSIFPGKPRSAAIAGLTWLPAASGTATGAAAARCERVDDRVSLSAREHIMQHRLTIDYGDEVLFSSGLTRLAFDEEARFLLAAKLYEVGRLSSGLAAKLCGKSRVDFLLSLPRIGVPVSNLQPEDLDSEVEFMQRG
jgi:predicted HTH domain antitoxin